MPIRRFLGFTRHQRPPTNNNDDPSLDGGELDPCQTNSLSETSAPITAVRLEALKCKPRLPTLSNPSTVDSNSRSGGSKRSSSSEQRRLTYTNSEIWHSQRDPAPGQARNFSHPSLLTSNQETAPANLREAGGQSRHKKSADQLADDFTKLPAPPTHAKSTTIPMRYDQANLSSHTINEVSGTGDGHRPSRFISQQDNSEFIPHQPKHRILGPRTKSLSCLKSICGLNRNGETNDQSEMLSTAYFLPKGLRESYALSCTTKAQDEKTSFPTRRRGISAICRSLMATTSCDEFTPPSPRRSPSAKVHRPQTYTPPHPAGFRTSQSSLSEYHHLTVAHEDEIIQDPCCSEPPGESQPTSVFRFPFSRRSEVCPAIHPPHRPSTFHSPSESHFSFVTIYCTPEMSCTHLTSGPHSSVSEAQTGGMNSHIDGIHSHAVPPSQDLRSLRTTDGRHPPLPWSLAKMRSFPSFSQESLPASDSLSSTSDDRRTAVGFVGDEEPLKIQLDTQTDSPYQRDMLQIMATHGESIFKPPASIELGLAQSLPQEAELSSHFSTRTSAAQRPRDKPKTFHRSQSLTRHHIHSDGHLPSDIYNNHEDGLRSANRRLNVKPDSETLFPSLGKQNPSPQRQAHLQKQLLSLRPSPFVLPSRTNGLVGRLSQPRKDKLLAAQHEQNIRASKHDKFEALLKASDASHGGTLKMSLSSKIDQIIPPMAAPTSPPQLRLSCDSFSRTHRRSGDSVEIDMIGSPKMESTNSHA
ncbi:hypothetical protein MJO29_007604 [Puccinia striiformis f. sp. tritici]|uniref:hypothetical protein n=1 Tax=Puccinia striiformis f. sp. tritici TaxID=168172 RepID=UPI002008C970|nr:hypothetical protein Pst134EA_013754 [Puccinia striiformis f. sp. tritici]KAH9465894.1 hypothetical protein Pst134EA_013754 [Puccinia striiformis f. sp. tritici]KAI7956205.1 hypothetical protein MJO29_007604 [Puccinia striiformis f. sp. tritici]